MLDDVIKISCGIVVGSIVTAGFLWLSRKYKQIADKHNKSTGPVVYTTSEAIHDTNPVVVPDDVDWEFIMEELSRKCSIYGFCTIADLMTLCYGFDEDHIVNNPFLGDYRYGWVEEDLKNITVVRMPGTPGTTVYMPKVKSLDERKRL